jgi:hypothetical protein
MGLLRILIIVFRHDKPNDLSAEAQRADGAGNDVA